MTRETIGGCALEYDAEATRRYDRRITLCECAGCRNYRAQIRKRYPELAAFLERFGVDAARPDELSWVEAGDGTILYDSVDYTVCGRVFEGTEYRAPLPGRPETEVFIRDEYVPNEQTGEYFTVSFTGVRLPYVLNEPL